MSENEEVHSEEELRMIVADSFKGGEINPAEFNYVNRIFEFDDRVAKEVMVPRTEIFSLEKDMTLTEVFTLMDVEQYTRYPVTDGDKDHIIGFVNMKQLLSEMIRHEESGQKKIEEFVQPIIQVIETIPIGDLLIKFQAKRIHIAILLDEYGGTSGLVTIEDIIEEIVGEIRDEFDADELPEKHEFNKNHFNVSGKLLIDEVNDLTGMALDDEDIDTIGGWFMAQRSDVQQGDTIDEQGFRFTAIEVNNHQIVRIDIKRLPEARENLAEAEAEQ